VSALADALVAAQRRALGQLEKEFVRSVQDDPEERAAGFRDTLAAIGLTDRLEVESLIACLEVLRTTGGALPAEPTNGGAPKPQEKASERQQVPLAEQDIRNLTKARASQLIDAIGAGTYDPNEWDVPI
jgi:hypothetical protein